MTGTRDDVTVDFDPHRPAQLLNLDLACAELRHTCPVAWSEAHGGFWILTAHEDVRQAGLNSRAFSTTGGVVLPPPPYGDTALINFDPPEHTPYRRAMNPGLSLQAVNEKIRPRIEYWTDLFIDRVIETGSCDAVYELAVAIPTAVTMEWLGWDNQDEWWQLGKAWHDLQGRALNSVAYLRAAEIVSAFDGRIAEELAMRAAQPRDDEMSRILAVEIEGAPIPREHVISLVRILVGAGVDTTTSLIGAALVHLHFNPDERRRLAEAPELWKTATEEFLRRYPPSRALVRTCVQEVEVGGQILKPGDFIYAPITSANQDHHIFDEPLRFDMERTPNPHLSFGAGVHKCLGMHLARAEFEIVMQKVLERLPDYRMIEDQLLEYSRQSTINGWMKAPMTFTPGARILNDRVNVNIDVLKY